MSGAGSGPEYWYRLTPLLEQAGHVVVPVGLPNQPGATLTDQADAIVAAAGAAPRVVLVAQSMAGFSAPLACDRLPVAWLVLVNAMIPRPDETAGAWWENTGQPAAARANDEREGRDPEAPFDVHTVFLHDVPPEILERVLETETSEPADSLFAVPFDRPDWPALAPPTDVGCGTGPTVLCGREI